MRSSVMAMEVAGLEAVGVGSKANMWNFFIKRFGKCMEDWEDY